MESNNKVFKEKLTEVISKLNKKDFTINFFIIDTKGVANGNTRFIYETAKDLIDNGYKCHMLYQQEKEVAEVIENGKRINKEIEVQFIGVREWMGDDYANIPHGSIGSENIKVSTSDFLIIPEIFANVMNQTKKLPCDWKDILQFSKVRCPLNHPAVIFRKSIIESVGGYPLLGNEDYALWSLLIKKGYCLGNIPIILVKYRLGMSFLQRRGVHMLAKEIELLQYQRSIQFINSYEYYRNIFLRSLLRCSPYCLKKFLYQFSRTKYGLLPKK